MKHFWQLRYIISKHHGGYPDANWVSRKPNKHKNNTYTTPLSHGFVAQIFETM